MRRPEAAAPPSPSPGPRPGAPYRSCRDRVELVPGGRADHTLTGARQRVLSRADPPHFGVETESEFLVVPLHTGPEDPAGGGAKRTWGPGPGPPRLAASGGPASLPDLGLHPARARAPPGTRPAVQAPRPRRPPGPARPRACLRRLRALGLSGSEAPGRPHALGAASLSRTRPAPAEARRPATNHRSPPNPPAGKPHFFSPSLRPEQWEVKSRRYIETNTPEKFPVVPHLPCGKRSSLSLGRPLGIGVRSRRRSFSPPQEITRVWYWSAAPRVGSGAALTPGETGLCVRCCLPETLASEAPSLGRLGTRA